MGGGGEGKGFLPEIELVTSLAPKGKVGGKRGPGPFGEGKGAYNKKCWYCLENPAAHGLIPAATNGGKSLGGLDQYKFTL